MYTLLNTGDVPGAASYFNPLVQQSVIPCTSGSRPTPSHEGMLIYETDTDRYKSWGGAAWLTLGQTVDGAYTPTLTAASVNPTIGSGSYVVGRFTLRNGIWCDVSFTVQFGSSGAVAGTGQYFIALPFTTAADITNGVPYCGSAYLRDASGPAAAQGLVYAAPSAATCSLLTATTTVTNAVPWTWANSDYISGSLTYRTA